MVTRHSRLKVTLLALCPGALLVLLTLATAVPLRIPGLAQFMPMFAVMGVFYWSIYKPRLLPYVFLFLLGLMHDALLGTPLGVTSLVLIVLRAMLTPQRRFFSHEAFIAVWLGFLVVSLLASLAFWVILSLYNGTILVADEPVIQWGITVALYPVFHVLFNRIYFALPGAPKLHKH